MAEAISSDESSVYETRSSQIGNSPKKPPPRCHYCNKQETIHLKCRLHYLCQDCLQAKTEKEGTAEMYVCRECAPATPKFQSTPVFVDHSNLWIEAQKLGANRKRFGSKLDHRVRIDYSRLRNVIAKGRQLDATVYVSDENLKLNISGFEVKRLPKSKITGKEKEVDTTLCKDIQALTKVPKKGTAILVSGDRDMRPAVEEILKDGWSVEIYMWQKSIAHGLKQIEGNVKIIPLDEYWDEIVEIKTVFKKIPKNHASSIVLTVKSGIFPKETRIDYMFSDWWENLEQFCNWPVRYKWLTIICEETRHLLLVLSGSEEKDINKLVKRINDGISCLNYAERCETYTNFLERAQRGPAKQVTDELEWTEVVRRRHKRVSKPAESKKLPTESNSTTEVKTLPVNSKEETAGCTARSSQACCSGKNCEDGLKCEYSHNKEDTKYFQLRENGLGNKFRKTHLCDKYPHCPRSTIRCDFAHGESDAWCSHCHTSGHFYHFCQKHPCKHPKHTKTENK